LDMLADNRPLDIADLPNESPEAFVPAGPLPDVLLEVHRDTDRAGLPPGLAGQAGAEVLGAVGTMAVGGVAAGVGDEDDASIDRRRDPSSATVSAGAPGGGGASGH